MSAPLSSLTRGELSAAGRKALKALDQRDFVRVTSGWRGAAGKVTLSVADQLKARGLARVEIYGGRHRLTITGSGRMLAAVLDQRTRR